MKGIRVRGGQVVSAIGVALCVAMSGWAYAADKGADVKGMSLKLGSTEYVHRWSKAGQNEFTPKAQADLSRWTDMVTLNVHPAVTNGDQLAQVANTVLGNYQANGRILRTDSKPRTDEQEAEHFAAALLGADGVQEVAFARFVLVDGVGVVAVRSHRVYGSGKDVGAAMGQWLETNGEKTEIELMGWKALPRIADLAKLPQAP